MLSLQFPSARGINSKLGRSGITPSSISCPSTRQVMISGRSPYVEVGRVGDEPNDRSARQCFPSEKQLKARSGCRVISYGPRGTHFAQTASVETEVPARASFLWSRWSTAYRP